jgi:hypothetical protein
MSIVFDDIHITTVFFVELVALKGILNDKKININLFFYLLIFFN